jgi:acetoin utilization protein AcuB
MHAWKQEACWKRNRRKKTMSKTIPSIKKYMTPMPHTIGPDQSIAFAKKTMRDLNVRHLPVRSGGKLIGILSERDIDLLASFKDIDLDHAQVKDAMTFDPYVANPDTLLDEVCIRMAEKKIGSALIAQDNGTLVGIFTYIDALRAISELFFTRLKVSR